MKRKKHILFIVENNSFPGDPRVRAEAEAAKEFGYKVSVIAPMSNGSNLRYESVNGIEVYRHPMPVVSGKKFAFAFEYASALFWEAILSIKIFIKKPFHIIHGANPPDHLFLIALLFKIFGTKYIFDHHDISPEMYCAKFGRKDIFYKALLQMEKLNFKSTDIVISTNESYKKIAISRGKKNAQDVFVVRNGPNLVNIPLLAPKNELKKNFDYLIAYVGSISISEGIDNLLRSIEYIVHRKNIKNIKFVVIGEGSHWQNMVQLSKQIGIDKYVAFPGYIPFPDFYGILAAADICVDPEFKTGYSDKCTMLKTMDYMVPGRPIIQFDTTEGKVTAGNAAVYVAKNDAVDFAEAIIELLDDPERRKKMGEIGRKKIYHNLNWDHQKVNLKKAYQFLEDKYFGV